LERQAAPRAARDVEPGQDTRPHDRNHQPGGLRELLPRAGPPRRGRPPPFDTLAALAASYGLEFCDAPSLPDIIVR
jgi:hypothetical protein